MNRADVFAKWSRLGPIDRDIWVAETVMGLPSDYVWSDYSSAAEHAGPNVNPELPKYTQSIEAAMAVAEKLGLGVLPVNRGNHRGGWVGTRMWVASNDSGELDIMPIYPEPTAEMVQPTPAEAICLAGLVYVEGQGGEG